MGEAHGRSDCEGNGGFMSIQPDRKYIGKVEPGSTLFESKNSGTLGFRVNLSCEDGQTHFDIWMTPKTFERAEKTFIEVLGVPREKLSDGDYVATKLSDAIVGREVEFDTEDEEYNNETRTKVKWLNRPGGSVMKANPERMVHFFLGNVAKPATDFPEKAPTGTPIEDSDIPFRYRSAVNLHSWYPQ